jgi:hypothetical protein
MTSALLQALYAERIVLLTLLTFAVVFLWIEFLRERP